ncbi:MAG TPA: translation initiation factor eIF-1A [Candidatus Thermoplasmatota archaeon]|nr:translation initiation factor eIF-1A [Candidatus Thermoplasmatota archaeon]
MVDYRKADAQFDADAAAAAAEGGNLRVKMPDKKEGELFGIADALVGGSRLEVMCEDGVKRLARIPGKMKRRMWIREGDLVIVKPWDFQNDKADVVWRYTKTQAEYLSRKDMIPKQIDVFQGSSGGGP